MKIEIEVVDDNVLIKRDDQWIQPGKDDVLVLVLKLIQVAIGMEDESD